MSQTAQKGNTVSVEYTGKLENGDIFDTSIGKDPLSFTMGASQVIPGFDNALMDMAVGDSKTVNIPPEEAYGERKDDLFVSMPLASVPPDMDLKPEMMVHLTDKSGNPVPATVISIEGENVNLDVNHPMAGKTLIFEIELVKIEENE
jgi:peptidylprolyl isomerase